MRSTIRWALTWLAAAVLAVTVAWQGVGVVGTQFTDERAAPLTAAEVREAAESTDTSSPSPSSTVPSAPSTSTTLGSDGGGSGGGDDRGDDDGRTSTTTPGSPSTTTPTSAPPSGGTSPAPSETRTYNLEGGSAALRFEPSGVSVVWATPNPGFEVEVEPEHVNGVKVEFRSEDHRSRVDGWWEGGPVDRVREEAG